MIFPGLLLSVPLMDSLSLAFGQPASSKGTLITETWINGVLVVQNRYQAQTMAVIDLTLEQDGAGWKVVDRTSRSVDIAGYGADPAMVALLKDYDLRAREDANRVIGRLEGGALAPESGNDEIYAAMVQDTERWLT